MWNYWQEDWSLYHKVIFDGANRVITVDPSIDSISVKEDIYSSYKEWLLLRDNAKFEQALRTIGGDPVGGGLYAGDMYFLMNGWQIHVTHNIRVNGILYHDDVNLIPYVILPGGGVTSTVSSLAYAYNTTGASVTLADIENSPMIAKQSTLTNVWKATKLATALSA